MSQLLLHLLRCSLFLLTATLLLELLVCVCRLKSAAMHRAIWGAVLLVSLLGFAIPIAVPVVHVSETPVQVSPEPLANPASMPQVVPQHVSSLPEQHEALLTPPHTSSPFSLPPDPLPLIPSRLIQHWQSLVLTVWVLGVAVLIVRQLISHTMMGVRLLRQVKPIDDATHRQWETLLTRHGFRRTAVPIRLTESTGPAIIHSGVGFVLLIPEAFWDELTPELRDGVLRHELGHLVHRDTLLSPLAYLLATLQWFNPAAWHVLKRYNKATEWHADEFAYGLCHDGSSLLAETFLAVHRSTESRGLTLHSFARFSTLDRVNHLTILEQSGKEHAMKKYIIGAVALTLLLAGTFRIEFVAVAKTVTGNASQEITVGNVSDRLEDTTETTTNAVIRGRVVDEDGNPVANAKVGYFGISWKTELPTTTDQNGEFILAKMNFDNPYFASGELQAIDAERTRIGHSYDMTDENLKVTPIVLRKARTITGTVVDADGKPAKDVLVAGCNQLTDSEIVKTNEQGEFEFLYPEKMSLQTVYAVQKDTGFDFVPTNELPSFYGETPKELIKDGPFHLKLRPVESFKIRVVDESGNPIAGAIVTPWLIENPVKPKNLMPGNDLRTLINTSGMHIFNVNTDADGYAVINSVPGDFLKHSVFSALGWNATSMPDGAKRNFGTDHKSWEELTQDDATFALPLMATVHGSVKLEDGTPVPGARLTLRFHEGSCGGSVTDENGEFTLLDNANTLYNISINSDKGAAPAIFNFNVGDGMEEKRLDIVLEKGIRVYGQIFNPDGTLVKHIDVTLTEIDPNPPESYDPNDHDVKKRSRFVYGTNRADRSLTGKDGAYEGLISREPRECQLYARGYPGSNFMVFDSQRLKIKGDEEEIHVDFHLEDHSKVTPTMRFREADSEDQPEE